MNDNQLRQKCKMIKALQNISYKEMAELLEIKQDSFYSYLRGNYSLGEVKHAQLEYIISTLAE